jgi:DNA-binding transcriptional ArsR family regulator
MGALAAAMGHPVKAGILSALADGYPLRVDQIARRIRIGSGRVRYHSARLVQEGLIQELGGSRRGQKLYALVIIPILWPKDLDSLGAEETDKVFAEVFRRILIDVAGAISAGTFYRRPDFCQIRLPLAVDQEGWDEIQDLHIGLFEEVDSAHMEALARLKGGREVPISATAGIVWVELPPTPGGQVTGPVDIAGPETRPQQAS